MMVQRSLNHLHVGLSGPLAPTPGRPSHEAVRHKTVAKWVLFNDDGEDLPEHSFAGLEALQSYSTDHLSGAIVGDSGAIEGRSLASVKLALDSRAVVAKPDCLTPNGREVE
jgi:hypothetical protein